MVARSFVLRVKLQRKAGLTMIARLEGVLKPF
jgi:hypothetical protein